MSPRVPGTSTKRKAGQPPLVGGGKRTFRTSLTHGVQVERGYRRMYPLSDDDIEDIHRIVKRDLKDNRKGHDWAYVRFQVNVQGGLYVPAFESLFDEDEKPKWEKHWISTRAVPSKSTGEVLTAVDELLTKRMEVFIRGRAAWLLRMEVVLLQNEPRT